MQNDYSQDLSVNKIRDFLPIQYKNIEITVLDSTDSTNTRLKEMAKQGAPDMSVLIARHQTNGRGRQGRSFFSPVDTGLYMSILIRPESPSDIQLMTIRTANAVCRAIKRTSPCDPEIKWVNDIYCNKKKVCGILCEAEFSPDGRNIDSLIVGIGINCTTSESSFPEDIRDIASSISLETSKSELAADVIAEFWDELIRDADAVLNEYRARSMITGKYISFTESGKEQRAYVTGITDEGNLIVRLLSGEERTLFSGEVHILKDFLDGE